MPLTKELLAAALVGLEAQRQRIEGQITEVRALMGKRAPGRPPVAAKTAGAIADTPAPRKRRKRKRKLSPEGRANIIAAIQKRWAAVRKQQR